MIDVADFIRRQRNFAGYVIGNIDFTIARVQLYSVLRRPVEHRNQVRFHMSYGRILQSLFCEKRYEMVPEHAADHGRHDGATELPLDILQLVDQHTIVLLNLRM